MCIRDRLYLDGYIDQKIRFLARDDEILKVEEMVSDEIVYENAWISGFSGKTVTVSVSYTHLCLRPLY